VEEYSQLLNAMFASRSIALHLIPLHKIFSWWSAGARHHCPGPPQGPSHREAEAEREEEEAEEEEWGDFAEAAECDPDAAPMDGAPTAPVAVFFFNSLA